VSATAQDAAREGAADPYAAIVAHAELELELAGRGEVDALLALGARWEHLTRDLPAQPPAWAGAQLERARLIHERTRIDLIRLREATMAELATARRARHTADGYAGQVQRRPRVDRSA
jgi:hypothetical protein